MRLRAWAPPREAGANGALAHLGVMLGWIELSIQIGRIQLRREVAVGARHLADLRDLPLDLTPLEVFEAPKLELLSAALLYLPLNLRLSLALPLVGLAAQRPFYRARVGLDLCSPVLLEAEVVLLHRLLRLQLNPLCQRELRALGPLPVGGDPVDQA